jgi:hypothetical protein
LLWLFSGVPGEETSTLMILQALSGLETLMLTV